MHAPEVKPNLPITLKVPEPASNALLVPCQFGTLVYRAVLDTGAFSSGMPKEIFDAISTQTDVRIVQSPPPDFNVLMAHTEKAHVLFTATIQFKIGQLIFEEKFLVFPKLNSILLGFPFLHNYELSIDVRNRRLTSPQMSFILSQYESDASLTSKANAKPTIIDLYTTEDIIIQPNQEALLILEADKKAQAESTVGVVTPIATLEKKYQLFLTNSLSKVTNGCVKALALNLAEIPIRFTSNTCVAKFEILTPEQAKYLTPLDSNLIQCISNQKQQRNLSHSISLTQSGNHTQETRKFTTDEWYATPENCAHPEQLKGPQKTIYDTIKKFNALEQMDPITNENHRKKFLNDFDWTGSILSMDDRRRVEDLLVRYNDIFARHRLDIGKSKDFTVTLTPQHDDPVYSQSPPTPLHLKDELFVELALLQHYGIIKPLDFSKYSSPLFAQRKPSGKLRLLVDLRKINHLITKDYHNNNFPISTLADASSHLAGKKIFCKMDGSQGYFTIPLADERSIQLLAFNFSSRTFAFTRLAQGLSRSMSSFSSYMRKFLDPVITADKCFQYVDDIGLGAKSVDEMLAHLDDVFLHIRNSGLKLSVNKCQFGLDKIEFLGNTITPEGMAPTLEKVEKFLKDLPIPKNVRQVKRMIGFYQFYKAFLPGLAEKLLPFYQLLRSTNEFQLTDKHHETFEILKQDLKNACQMTLRLPIAEKQYIIMADASFYAAGYVLLVDDYTCDTNTKTSRKQYAPVSFGSKIFQPSQLKLSIYAKEFLAVHFALQTFAHIVWGIQNPILILTDNRALTRFFQAKTIPSSLWSAVDHVLSFNFVLGHIPGNTNVAADYLSRIHINPHEKLRLKISDRLPTQSVTVDFVVNTPDNSISHFLAAEHTPWDEKPTDPYVNGLYSVNALASPNPLDDFNFTNNELPLNLAAEQRQDKSLSKVIEWIRTNKTPSPAYLKTTELKYFKQLPRLMLKDGVLYRKFFDQTGKVSHEQFCVPEHLQKELLYRIHNSRWRGHIGITRTIAEFRKRFYFPNFTEILTDYIRNCLTCLQTKEAKQVSLKPPLQPVASERNFPADTMQIDLVGKLQASPHTFVLTAIDVFSRYLFAVALTKGESDNVAKALISIFLRHAYIPRMIICDLGTAFTSTLMTALTAQLEVQLKYCTLKHAQSIGLVERSHGPLKHILKLNSNESFTNWHKYLDFAVFIHNTTYNPSIGCTPSDLFHGRPPITPLDLRFQNAKMRTAPANFEVLRELQDAATASFERAKESMIAAYHNYRQYYDRKANATPLDLHSYCLILEPKSVTQNDPLSKGKLKWLPLYRVEKVLTNSNYIVRKVGTNETQCLHRMRLRPCQPQFDVEDLPDINEQNFAPDASLTNENTEPELFDNAIVQHIFQQRKTVSDPGLTKNIQFSSERSVITFQPDSLPTSPIKTTSEPTFHDAIDRESFVVEGHVPTLMEDGPEVIDTTDYRIDNPDETSSDDARYGATRRYALRRDDRFALARQFTMYNSISHLQQQLESTCNPTFETVYCISQCLTLEQLLQITNTTQPIALLETIRRADVGDTIVRTIEGKSIIFIVVRKHELDGFSLPAFRQGLKDVKTFLHEQTKKQVAIQMEQFPKTIVSEALKIIQSIFDNDTEVLLVHDEIHAINEQEEEVSVILHFPNDDVNINQPIGPDSDSEIEFGRLFDANDIDNFSDASTLPANDSDANGEQTTLFHFRSPKNSISDYSSSGEQPSISRSPSPPRKVSSPTPLTSRIRQQTGPQNTRTHNRRVVPLLLHQKLIDGNLRQHLSYDSGSD